jgi:hypothetical protein
MKKLKFLLIITLTLAFLTACPDNPNRLTNFSSSEPPLPAPESDASSEEAIETIAASLSVTFDFDRQSGWASNQFAVWLEDSDGGFVRTLYVTGWTAGGGFNSRTMSLPTWVERSKIAETPKTEVDAVSSATPRTEEVSVGFWFIGEDELPPGEYRFFVEGTLRWSNQVLFSGIIDTSGDAVIVEAEAEYTYIDCDNHKALTVDSPENSMISNVVARFTPETIIG